MPDEKKRKDDETDEERKGEEKVGDEGKEGLLASNGRNEDEAEKEEEMRQR